MNVSASNSAFAPPVKVKSLYIPSLDGIRAVSFMLVFIAHCGLEKYIPGGLGVTIFFFLSGYLITTLLRQEADQTGRISIRDFYIRRVLRIFPPFYLTILLGVLLHLTGVLKGALTVSGVMFQSIHLANYWSIHHIIVHNSLDGITLGSNVMWSLAVEEHFYLMFPVLYVVLRKNFSVRGQTVILVLICLAMLAWRYALVHHFGAVMERTYFATDTRADSILWGCIFAIACNPMLDERRLPGLWLLVILAVAVGVMAFTLVYRDEVFRETLRYTLHGLILFPVFTAAIVYHESPAFRWLNFKPIRHLGVLSYSLYLVHFTVIYIVQGHVPVHPVLQGIIAFALSFAVSSAIYRWVEKPCARLRKRFSHASGGKTSGAVGSARSEHAIPMATAS